MSYCTLADLLATPHGAELLTELAPDGLGSYDSAAVSAAIAKADGVINDYLSGRYTLPITPTAGIKTRALAITWYLLFPQGWPDHVRTEYEDAIRFFEQVAKGLISLAPAVPGDTVPPETSTAAVIAPAQVFTSSLFKRM